MWPIERIVVPPSLRTRSASDVGHREHLVGLLVEQQMVVAVVAAGDVPVEIFRLDVEREGVGYKRIDRFDDLSVLPTGGRSASPAFPVRP